MYVATEIGLLWKPLSIEREHDNSQSIPRNAEPTDTVSFGKYYSLGTAHLFVESRHCRLHYMSFRHQTQRKLRNVTGIVKNQSQHGRINIPLYIRFFDNRRHQAWIDGFNMCRASCEHSKLADSHRLQARVIENTDLLYLGVGGPHLIVLTIRAFIT